MPTLTESRERVRGLANKMLGIAEDDTLSDAEKLSQLKAYEDDLSAAQKEVADKAHIEDTRRDLLGAANPDEPAGEDRPTTTKSLGQQFVESRGYNALMQRGLAGGTWTTGDIELKTTLTEGTAGTPGPGYQPSIISPTVLPGVVDIRQRTPMIEDLFPGGTTSSPLIRYLVETSITNAAATVAEGGLKPESALAFDRVDETLHKVASFLPLSDEMLEDWEQVQSYVDGRLSLFIRLTSEMQLLTGDGTGSNLVGILNRPGLRPAITRGTAPSLAGDNAMDAIYRQITAIRTNAFLEPDAIVVDPTTWQNILLARNSQGFYYANGPFANAQPESLWGKRVTVTPVMTAGTALVGAFGQGGQVFSKGGITVEASNSHADYFQRNQTAIRAERRLALAVYRPGAFGTVTGL